MISQEEKFKNFSNKKKKCIPLVCLTAYTYPMAKLIAPHVDLVLVGDSLGMVIYGMKDTTGVSMEHMRRHGQAVVKASENTQSIIVVDMPFGSYEESDELALSNAKYLLEETGCDAVKLEGGLEMSSRIKTLVENNIPVMGHIGLLPQSAPKEGGFKIKGKNEEQVDKLIKDIITVEKAGAFSIVIEGTIESVAADLSKLVSVPTIGIGASADCDGQILVTDDMLGISGGRIPKFVKPYADLGAKIESAVKAYAADVRERKFPSKEYTY